MRVAVLAALAAVSASLAAEAAPPPASAFAALPEMSLVRLSPSGERVAWANDPGGSPIVVVFDVATGKDLKRIQPPNARVRDLDWADDRTLIISVSRTLTAAASTLREQAYEFERYLAIDVEDPKAVARSLLMEHPDRESVTAASIERLHPEKPGTVIMSTYQYSETSHRGEIGSRLSGGRKDSGWELTLFEVELASGKGRVIESGSVNTRDWILDPAGRPVARTEWDAESLRFTILAKEGASWKTIFSEALDYEFDVLGLAADGRSLLVRSPRGSERFKIWSLPLSGGELALAYEDAQFDVYGVRFDRFTAQPAGYRIGGPDPHVAWTDPKMQSIHKAVAKAFAGKSTSVFDRSADYKRIIAEVESDSSPPVYYLIDFDRGAADIIGEAYPSLADVPLGTVESTSYKSPDGIEVPAYLTLPPGAEPKSLPLVVFPHGGPWARDTADFDWWVQFLATRGYAVLQPQFRGSWGFGADLYRAGNRQWGRGMQEDITAGVRELVAKGIADPKRVCIVGASYGGYAALAGAAFTPDVYACAVSVNGIADIPQMAGFIRERDGDDSPEYRSWRDLIGNPSDEDLMAFSPSRAVDAIRAPILLIHATNDTVVPPSQSRIFADLLRKKGKGVELIELSGEDHWLSTGRSRLTVLEALDGFLAAHLR
ncbi:MAG TPA: S9 family peptidase [Steroidobacteraceae bacterium]|jgi:dipeptidyl aminopeptidase/acylaminoacyl peptidase|nr:S9 family peptidase [Steroidobacteraceae bacterium]